MLKLKKVITKKVIIYIIIILVIGIIFFIYQKQINDKIDYIGAGADKDILSPSKISTESDLKLDLDTSIFINPKFMYLKDNKYKDEQAVESEKGKLNPFESSNLEE